MIKKIFLLAVLAITMNACQTGYEEKTIADLGPGFVSDTMLAYYYQPASRTYYVGHEHIIEVFFNRYTPCSSFKIMMLLMGLDRGVITPETRLGYDGTKYDIEAWNADVNLEEAFRASCVPYFRKVMDRLDSSYVQQTLNALRYGNSDISAWNAGGHHTYWIESSLEISPMEQVMALEKIFKGESQFKPEHVAFLKQCMRYDDAGNIRFYGKTGTGRNPKTKRLEGWCVGFWETPDGDTIYYAVHADDPKRDIMGPEVRDFLRRALEKQ